MSAQTLSNQEALSVEHPSEIQSRWGRALFDTVFHGGLAVEVGVAGYFIADAITDSDLTQITMTGAAGLSGLVASFAVLRFSK